MVLEGVKGWILRGLILGCLRLEGALFLSLKSSDVERMLHEMLEVNTF